MSTEPTPPADAAQSSPVELAADASERLLPGQKPPGSPVMYQRWAYLLFLHWPVPVSMLRPLLPSRLTVDTFGGQAYVGLVLFTMTGVRPIFLPAVPCLSNFHETNVRTYVHNGGKDPGVWFFSLDAANAVAVKLAQWLFKLPYFFADMKLSAGRNTRAPGLVDYATERKWPAPTPASAKAQYEVTGPAAPATPGTLEHFLVERYILYTEADGKLKRGRVHHSPYPVQPARLHSVDESLIAASKITRPSTAPLVHYASEVQVDIYGIEDV